MHGLTLVDILVGFGWERACTHCQATKRLLLHHIDGDDGHNEPSNWMILCRSCHIRHHRAGVPRTDEEKAKISATLKLRWPGRTARRREDPAAYQRNWRESKKGAM